MSKISEMSSFVKSYTHKYIIVDEPTYCYIRMTPSSNINNSNTDSIMNLLSSLYKDLTKRTERINNILHYEKKPKIGFYIYMENTNDENTIQFYFIVPKRHFKLYKTKFIDAWKGKITPEEVDDLPILNQDCTKYYLSYKKKDAMSLNCSKNDNFLLTSILNNINIIQDGDKLAVLYTFESCKIKGWKNTYDNTIEKLRKNQNIDKDYSAFKVFWILLLMLCNFLDNIFQSLGSNGQYKTAVKQLRDVEKSPDTDKKRSNTLVINQIICLSESTDKLRERDNCTSLCSSFDIIKGDNELVAHKLKPKLSEKIDVKNCKSKGAKTMLIQSKESQNYIALPSQSTLQEFDCIDCIKTQESNLISAHRKGVICVGDVRIKNTKDTEKAYLYDHYDNGGSVTLSFGQQGSGKTELNINMAKNCIDNDISVINIDFIKSNEFSKELEKITPKEKLIIVDFSKFEDCQSFAFTELKPNSDELDDIIEVSNRKALQMKEMIDALSVTSGDIMTPAMQDITIYSSTILYCYNQNASMSDLYKFITNYNFRNNVLTNLRSDIKESYQEAIEVITSNLDATDKTGSANGKNISNTTITGLCSRINLLRLDYRLLKLFSAPSENNIDIFDAIDKHKVILFRLPQDVFSSTYSKDTIVCYLISRIWNAFLMIGRKYPLPLRPPLCYLFIDELFQCPTSINKYKTTDILLQQRKFGLRLMITGQNARQYRAILEDLHSTGCNVIFMKGSINSFKEYSEELSPFTVEDIVNLPQYSALCSLCNSGDSKCNFICKLPKPVSYSEKTEKEKCVNE